MSKGREIKGKRGKKEKEDGEGDSSVEKKG